MSTNGEFAPFYDALDIAAGYLIRRGYSTLEAKQRAVEHIARLYRGGEYRALVLANLAISAVEKQERTELETQARLRLPSFRSAS